MEIPTVLALVAASGLLGSMLFFAAVAAPSVFRFLPAEMAGRYLRGLFPRYYVWGTSVAAVATVLALPAAPLPAGVLGGIAAAFLAVRQLLVPRINAARDAKTAGDEAASELFKRLHRLSVLINLAQMVALVFVLVLLAGA